MFVSQKCFVFFSILWFCQSSLGFRLLYNFGWHFHSAKVSHSGGRGCPFAGPYFFKKPFCKTLFGGAPFPGPMQSPFAGPQVQVKGATQVGLVLLAAGLLLLFFFLDFASCQPPSCSFVLVELVPSQLLGGPDPGLALGLSHWVDLQGCKSKVGRKIADHSPTESSNLHFWCQPFLSQENLLLWELQVWEQQLQAWELQIFQVWQVQIFLQAWQVQIFLQAWQLQVWLQQLQVHATGAGELLHFLKGKTKTMKQHITYYETNMPSKKMPKQSFSPPLLPVLLVGLLLLPVLLVGR